jgi:DNA polymerase-3 subunit alpha
MSLFGDWGDGGDAAPDAGFSERIPIPDIEFDKTARLRFEKEMLGLYVSDHPLMGVEWALRRRSDSVIAELAEKPDGAIVTVGGVITGLARKFTKRGDPMAVFTLEDLDSSIEVTVFPKSMLEHGHKLVDDAIVLVKGRVDSREDTPKLLCSDLTVLDASELGQAVPLKLRLPAATLSEQRIDTLKRLLSEHPGDSPVHLHLGEGKVLRLSDQFCVDASGGVIGELRVAFGHDAVLLG